LTKSGEYVKIRTEGEKTTVNIKWESDSAHDEAAKVAETFVNAPPVHWETLMTLARSSKEAQWLGESVILLDNTIEKLARVRGYLDGRYGHGCGDQGHTSAAKESNRLAAKVRKALGFTYSQQDLTF
jgi:hypothetical protein